MSMDVSSPNTRLQTILRRERGVDDRWRSGSLGRPARRISVTLSPRYNWSGDAGRLDDPRPDTFLRRTAFWRSAASNRCAADPRSSPFLGGVN